MEVTWKLDGIARGGGLADNLGRIPETGFLNGPAIASPTRTPGVFGDTECLTPATNPDPSLGTLTTRVEYQKPGFLKKLGFSFIYWQSNLCYKIALIPLGRLRYFPIEGSARY